jgi:uncharacterized membrane protein
MHNAYAARPLRPSVAEPTATPAWRPFVEKHALWLALGGLVVAGGLLYVGVQADPGVFYDHYWWPDIYGSLVVDAHQCKTDVDCPGVQGPPGVHAADNYTVKSELTYGVVLAVMLYGIYMGLFRRYHIRADGWFVAALLPWMALGPVGRALEDANVFCPANTIPCAAPSPFAYLYISPIIYVQIALWVIGAMLLGVWIERRASERGWRYQSGVVAGVLALGLVAFVALSLDQAALFSVLPPVWAMALACALAAGVFAWRARAGYATMNLTVFALGIPFAFGALFLCLRWIAGDVWAPQAWNGTLYRWPGFFVLVTALLVALLVWAIARVLHVWRVDDAWARAAGKASDRTTRRVGWTGAALLVLALLMAGVVPNLAPFFDGVPSKPLLIPLLGYVGVALLLVFAFLEVGRGIAGRPTAILAFALGINVAMVFAHVMDGVATWVALDDPFGFGLPSYSEKHPFSQALLDYWGGFLYPFAKLVMVLVVAWLLDREVKGDTEDEQNMVGLVKMAIFALGFGPGLRDLLRLTMGV